MPLTLTPAYPVTAFRRCSVSSVLGTLNTACSPAHRTSSSGTGLTGTRAAVPVWQSGTPGEVGALVKLVKREPNRDSRAQR